MPLAAGRPLARVIDYVRDRTEPGEYVVSLPEERLINFLAERRHPTRDPGTGPGWLATAEDEDRFIREVDGRPALKTEEARLEHVYRRLIGRPPSARERQLAQAFLKNASWGAFLQVLLCTNEFIYVD